MQTKLRFFSFSLLGSVPLWLSSRALLESAEPRTHKRSTGGVPSGHVEDAERGGRRILPIQAGRSRPAITVQTLVLSGLLFLPACKTKMDVQREQDMERLKQEVRVAKGTKADLDVVSEQVRTELSRMTSYVEDQTVFQRRQSEELKQEIQNLNARIDGLEQKLKALETAKEEAEKPPTGTLETGQRLIDAEHYDEASEVFREVIRKNSSTNEVRRARYLLAESLFLGKNYASAALEYSEYKRAYPKDSRIAEATFRQAQSFKSLNKKKEARLFFQEVLDKHPKSTLAPRARDELKRLK